MNREEIEKLIEESVQGNRKRRSWVSKDQIRSVLNTLFLIAAAIGLILYFALPENRILGMGIIGGGMILKIIEMFLRFML